MLGLATAFHCTDSSGENTRRNNELSQPVQLKSASMYQMSGCMARCYAAQIAPRIRARARSRGLRRDPISTRLQTQALPSRRCPHEGGRCAAISLFFGAEHFRTGRAAACEAFFLFSEKKTLRAELLALCCGSVAKKFLAVGANHFAS